VLIVGEELEMAAELIELVEQASAPEIIWVTRHEPSERPSGPLPAENDPFPRRRQMLAIERLGDGRITVHLSGESEEHVTVDRILALQGNRPDWSFASELQLDICPITDAPRPLAQHLLGRRSPFSVEYPAPDAEALITTEPNYYVLGRKSFGRMPGFLFEHGLRQIRDVFTIVGDRADLDLYK
jgi:hypothetical protein